MPNRPSMPKVAEPFVKNFPVVCIGGSAGGLDTYIRLLQNLRADMGFAFVIVNHMKTLPIQLHDVLPRYTTMPVELITDRLLIESNHVFIIPSNRDLHVLDGEFRLKPISKPRGWSDVITVFFAFTYDLLGRQTHRHTCFWIWWRRSSCVMRH